MAQFLLNLTPAVKWWPGLLALAILATQSTTADAQQIVNLPLPSPQDCVIDRANLIQPNDRKLIEALSVKLRDGESHSPIVVVTIHSMAEHGQSNLQIEDFARQLFNQWEIGTKSQPGKISNRGVLLLVSQGDRKARFETGAGWQHSLDVDCQRIMDRVIIPNFKQQQFSGGIREGVEELYFHLRNPGQVVTRPPQPSHWLAHWPLLLAALIVFIIVGAGTFSLIASGPQGWAAVSLQVFCQMLGSSINYWVARVNRRTYNSRLSVNNDIFSAAPFVAPPISPLNQNLREPQSWWDWLLTGHGGSTFGSSFGSGTFTSGDSSGSSSGVSYTSDDYGNRASTRPRTASESRSFGSIPTRSSSSDSSSSSSSFGDSSSSSSSGGSFFGGGSSGGGGATGSW